MKAVLCDRYGPPSSLRVAEVPRPEPGPGEVLVQVHAATVNRTDTATLRGHPVFVRAVTGLWRPKHRIAGMEFAGRVVAIGSDVQGFAESDRVFGLSPDRFGAQAEFVCVPETGAVAVIPDDRPYHEAVLCEGAWYASSTVSRLAEGDSILIYGASGAIGTAAVMLAKTKGARVTAVVGPGHVQLAQDLGADVVIDYTAGDFTAGEAPYDIVMDAVGKTSYFACRRLLRKGGQYCATDLGPCWSNIWLGLWPKAMGGPRVSVPFPSDAAGFVRRLAGLMRDGKVRAVIDRHFALDEIVAAYAYVESGQKTGIVVVDVVPSAPKA